MNDTVHFEKTLSSETLFEGRVITLTKDTALLENGKTATREVVHHHGGACILPYFADGTICMVRQFRYAMQQELWELPAGKLEKGEDPFAAAKRELEEECGLTADNYISLGEFYPTVGYDTEVIYTWVATGLHETKMHLDADEFLTPDRVPLEKAYQMVLSNEIKDGKTIAGILKLKALLAERMQLPTIIFDEIDTGVSGRIADAMGEIIADLSQTMQVVDITHLPQVASKGDTHFVVYKDAEGSHIRRLDPEERITEIAKMLSGSQITEAALAQARILLKP